MFAFSPQHRYVKCAIYRGPGGAGDATADATNAASIAEGFADDAAVSAAAASASASAAATAETNAETAETNAETAQTAAETAQAAAETAQIAAETAETNAETAQTAAETAQTAAETAETNAETAYTNTLAIYGSTTDVANAVAAAEAAQTAAETAETNAETAETNAASSASSASTSATNAATSATAAASSATAASTSETNAATSASAASTSATNASTSATAAAASATSAGTSETNAATSASNASSSETNAASSASAASTSATNASSSASAASTSASNAATSETNAATSESNAATSASNASISASNAATSEANAAASYDSFDDRYLGAKSSAPTLDNDNDALIVGALYFDTTSNALNVYTSSGWVAIESAVNGTADRYKYTATASQTTFSGSDDNANTLAYDVGYIDVYLNGIKLVSGTDFTASNGTSIVLTTGAALNDILEIIAYGNFSLADVYTKTQSDAKYQLLDADTAKLDVAQTFTAQQTFGELKETVYTLGTSGSIALDPANGSIQTSTLSGNPTFTDSLEAGQTIVLMLNGGASYTVTWPTITWASSAGNTAPTLTANDTLVFWKVSTTLYGAYVGSYA